MIQTHLYPARTFSNVLFPAPLGPKIAVSCPDLNEPLTPLSITLFAETMKNMNRLVIDWYDLCSGFFEWELWCYTRIKTRLQCSVNIIEQTQVAIVFSKFSRNLAFMQIMIVFAANIIVTRTLPLTKIKNPIFVVVDWNYPTDFSFYRGPLKLVELKFKIVIK